MRIISDSEKMTLHIGLKMSGKLKKGSIVCLEGPLGAGKTVIAKGIALGLGIDSDKVISPTFVLLREYEGKMPLYHFDLYRLNTPQDIVNLGYEEYLYGEGISVIEWAEKLERLIPHEFLRVRLMAGTQPNKRILEFSSYGDYYKDVLREIYESISH